MKIGTAYSIETDSGKAGKLVGESVLQNGRITEPNFILAFCNSGLHAEDFFAGLRAAVGDAPILGGSAIGIITNEIIASSGCVSGALALESDTISQQIATAGDLDKDEKAAGLALGKLLAPRSDQYLLFLLYDSIRKAAAPDTPPLLNASLPLVAGINETLKKNIPIFGAGVLGDHQFGATSQFCGDRVASQSAVGLLLSGPFTPYHRVMHGCTPISGEYHRITKKNGPFIHEIDNQPVVRMIDDLYGGTTWRKERPVNLLTIGVNAGERFDVYREENYINRLITGILPDESGICLFEPDLTEGTEIQFMLRDTARMIDSARRNTADLLRSIKKDGRKIRLGIYIDCAGRSARISNTLTEEAAEVRKLFNADNVPLFGFYSGVELAPYHGVSRGLDWTGVLLALTE
ncbi:FIST signal transduction protein [Thiovibrio sp. JS02]